MTKGGATSWRRWLAANLAWTLALLLATNAAWSGWFSQRFAEVFEERLRQEMTRFPRPWPVHLEMDDRVVVTFYESGDEKRYPWLLWYETTTTPASRWQDHDLLRESGLMSTTRPGWVSPHALGRGADLAEGERTYETFTGVGWPVPVLWCRWFDWCDPDPATAMIIADPPDPFTVATVLPFRPIWTGQLAYGTFWFVIVALCRLFDLVLREARHRRRAARCRCTSCNYDLQGNTTGVCPECGVEIHGVTS